MGNKRILLVDYDPKSLSHTRDILQTAGFDVATCVDGLTALDQFRSLTPDLVLLSAMLPKMHGFEVCSNIRKIPGGDKTPVVIITDVYKGKRYRMDAMTKYGATEYIEKPIEDSNLISILQNLIQGNGTAVQSSKLSTADEVEQKTMRFTPEDFAKAAASLEKANAEKPQPASPVAKKVEKQRPRDTHDIDRKLEESLAGLSLDFSRGALAKLKSKPKSAATAKSSDAAGISTPPRPTPPPQKPIAPAPAPKPESVKTPSEISQVSAMATGASISGSASVASAVAAENTFTSEDLFNDVIASVERELEDEKIITKSGVKETKDANTNPVSVVTPEVPKSTPGESKVTAKSSFDEELEKKISTTLSGILKDKTKADSTAKASAPVAEQKVEEAPATVQLSKEKVEEAIAAAKAASGEGINFGQYLLLSKIATGGMAELFKAKRKGVEGFEKILAIKRILPHMSDNEEFITMFIDEAKLAAQLTHHNVCQIFDLGKIDNSYYIAMEYVHGKDLRAVLKAARTSGKKIPVELGILITSKICGALDYAHRKKDSNAQPLNLVHRDVSPQNILISYEGDVKLVDFGIAKAATKMHVTQHGALKGKLLYMSPEQAWGKSVDNRSDIFSVCAVFYEMLAGHPLFFEEQDTEVTILEKVREAHVTPIRNYLPDVPQELEKILAKGLQKNPDERYQVASDMQKDLDNLFYTEGYNATGASLANFARNLFPEEWVQESGGRETIVLGKEVSQAIKTSLSEKTAAEKASTPTAAKAPAPVSDKTTERQKQVPTVIEQPPSISAAKPTPIPTPEPLPATPSAAAAPQESTTPKTKPQPAQTPAPVPAVTGGVTSATQQISTTGFRDISLPEIIPPQQMGGNMVKFLIGGIIFAVIVGGLVYYLYQPVKSGQQQSQQKQTQQKSEQPKVAESKNPGVQEPNTAIPVAGENPDAERQKQELLRLIDDEKKKVDALKEEQKKKEEQAQFEEQKKLLEQKRLDEAKKQEEETTRAEELKKAEEERLLEEQRQKEAADAEQAKLAQLQQQPAPTNPDTNPAPGLEVPQEPVVNEGDLVELTPDVVKPVITKKVEASYPPVARQKKVEGTVILQILVTETGQIGDVQILRPAGGSAGLNEAALAAVRQWTFRPAVKAGKRVKVRVTYPIVFKLQ